MNPPIVPDFLAALESTKHFAVRPPEENNKHSILVVLLFIGFCGLAFAAYQIGALAAEAISRIPSTTSSLPEEQQFYQLLLEKRPDLPRTQRWFLSAECAEKSFEIPKHDAEYPAFWTRGAEINGGAEYLAIPETRQIPPASAPLKISSAHPVRSLTVALERALVPGGPKAISIDARHTALGEYEMIHVVLRVLRIRTLLTKRSIVQVRVIGPWYDHSFFAGPDKTLQPLIDEQTERLRKLAEANGETL